MSCCPTCGSPISSVFCPPLRVGGTRRQLIFDLLRRRPHGVSMQTLADYVYADDPNGGPDSGAVTVRTLIHQLNQKLIAMDYPLRASGIGGRGSVYRLVRPDQVMKRFTLEQKLKIIADPRPAQQLAAVHRVAKNTILYWRKTLGKRVA